MAPSISTTAGSGSSSRSASAAASTACAHVRATTMATGSPTSRTLSAQSGDKRGIEANVAGVDNVNGVAIESRDFASITATTPGAERTSSRSSAIIRAWAAVLRTKTACNIDGSSTLPTKRPSPDSRRWFSLRRAIFPGVSPYIAFPDLGAAYNHALPVASECLLYDARDSHRRVSQ